MALTGPEHGTIFTKSMAVDDHIDPLVVDFVLLYLREAQVPKFLD